MGIELMLGIKPCKWFQWDINATWSKNRIKNFVENIPIYDGWNLLDVVSVSHKSTRIAFSYFSALIYLQDSSQYPLQLVMRNILLSSQMMSATPQSAMDPTAMAELTKQADSMKYALIIISSLPVLILYPFVQKFFVKGVMIGSVKG